jgi:hypothetical protein
VTRERLGDEGLSQTETGAPEMPEEVAHGRGRNRQERKLAEVQCKWSTNLVRLMMTLLMFQEKRL